MDKRTSRDWKATDGEVMRNTLHLDPITSHDRPVSPNIRVTTVSSSTSSTLGRYTGYKSGGAAESGANEDSKLPPIVSPAIPLSPKLLEPSLRVKALLGSYIKRKGKAHAAVRVFSIHLLHHNFRKLVLLYL